MLSIDDKLEILQPELEKVLGLEREIARLMEEREARRRTIENLMRNGASVEQGRIRAYFKTVPGKRSVSWKKVVVRLKGQGYCDNVLKHTKPGPDTERLVIE
jgi:hypothetical protein